MYDETTPTQPAKTKVNFALDLRIIIAILLTIMTGMLLVWKPWQQAPGANARTITVTGEATVKAEPDEYVFYPTYQFKNADKAAALKELTAKSNVIVAKLKELGVADKQIKTNAGGSDYQIYYPENTTDPTYSLTLTITLDNRESAQKVQDYLVTTSPTGSVTPQASFSTAKRKDLENQARDKATKEARSKADQSAKNLGFKIGAVKSVEDGAGFGGPIPLGREMSGGESVSDAKQELTVQPGENELNYTVTVVYFLR